jgi:hypothetical protein
MGFTWDRCSRPTLKRQKSRRAEGTPDVSSLGPLIREFQRDAAALPTDALQAEIEIGFEVLDTAIRQFYSIRPGTGTMDDRISATGDVMVATLMTALYVRELATRPILDSAAWIVTGSVN